MSEQINHTFENSGEAVDPEAIINRLLKEVILLQPVDLPLSDTED